jgi:hypothetical protein
MKKSTHIDVDQALVEGLSDIQRAHVNGCDSCSVAWRSAQEQVAQLRAIDASLSEVPEGFWEAQRRAIRVRADEAKPKGAFVMGYAWVGAAAAAVILAGSLLLPTESPRTTPPVAKTTGISDAALLESVQDQLEDYPEALHPARVMYTEMASAKAAPAKRK